MASEGFVRISRWEQIPELLRNRLLDEVAKDITRLAAEMQEGSALIMSSSDPYVAFVWDCAKVLREKMLRGDS